MHVASSHLVLCVLVREVQNRHEQQQYFGRVATRVSLFVDLTPYLSPDDGHEETT